MLLSIGLLVCLVLAVVEVKADWQAEWEKTVKAAEREGKVRVYASTSVGDLRVVWNAFQEKYPKIKITGVAPGRGSARLISLIFAERRAGKHLADVYLAAPTAIYGTFYRAKILRPVSPELILPEVTDGSKWWQGKHRYIDPESRFIFMYEGSLYGPPIAYNTKLIQTY